MWALRHILEPLTPPINPFVCFAQRPFKRGKHKRERGKGSRGERPPQP